MNITIQEAAKLLLIGLQDPDVGSSIPGYAGVDWQKVYDAMTQDHMESMQICGVHDWPSVLITALREIAGEDE